MTTKTWPADEVQALLGVGSKKPEEYTSDWERRNATFFQMECDRSVLEELVRIGGASPTDSQNFSPTIGELLELTEGFTDVIFEGYVVYPPRDDCRVGVDAVRFTVGDDQALVVSTDGWVRSADELSFDQDGEGFTRFRLWWD